MRRIRPWRLAAVVALTCVCGSAFGVEPPRMVIRKTAGRIEVDGKLDDPGWKDSAGFDRFVFLGADTPDYRKAKGMLAYDQNNLYIAVECDEDDARARFTEPGEGDTFPGGPHVEVWIESPKPPRNMKRNGLQFCANALGARYDGWLKGGPHMFDGRWRCAGLRLQGRWTVEMAIPFSDLGLEKPPAPGEPLRLDVGRGNYPLVSWAGSWGGLDEFSEFGLVFFGSDTGYAETQTPPDPNPKPQRLFVSPQGGDDNPGSKAKPFKTVQRAVDAAGPGDTVNVAPGLYRGRVMIRRGGTKEKPLVISGERGAVIHGGDVAKGWEPVGRGVYRKTGLAYMPYCMTWDDRSVLYIRRRGKSKKRDGYAVYFEKDPDARLWDGIEVVFSSEADTVWVRSRSGGNPDEHDITLAPRCSDVGGGAINLVGVRHVQLRGFTIKGGDAGIYMKDAGDNLIERNHIQHGKNSIYLHFRCHRNEIRDNYLTMRTFCNMNRLRSSPQAIRNVVKVIKGYGRADHHGILMFCTGHGNSFHHNCIYSHWDGVKANVYMPRTDGSAMVARQVAMLSPLHGRDFECSYNIIRDCWDYGIEPCGGEVNARYHHNLLYGHYGSRIKSVGTGPTYFYANMYATPYRGSVEGELLRIDRDPKSRENAIENRLAKCSFYISNQNDCKLYVYHNTFAGTIGIGLGRPPKRYSKNWWFVNNICSNERAPLAVWPERGTEFHVHHNYLSASHVTRGLTAKHTGNVLMKRLLWPAGLPGLFADFRIGGDWPVRGKGIDLSREWEREGEKHPALPGMEAGYFEGDAPDLGALQYGEDMPQVGPRW